MYIHASSVLLVATILSGCASAPEDTSRATGTADAIALAEKVVARAGGPGGLTPVQSVSFTFQDERHIDWDLAAGHVRIESLIAGTPWKAIDYDTRSNQAAVDPVGAIEKPKEIAKKLWINDTYWLLVTLKVLDPGVVLSIDDPQTGDLEGVRRLRLKFKASTGMTPDNEYVLHVREADGEVLQWDYYATPVATPRSWRFEEFGRYGSLWLSTWRPSIGGEGGVRLSDVRVK